MTSTFCLTLPNNTCLSPSLSMKHIGVHMMVSFILHNSFLCLNSHLCGGLRWYQRDGAGRHAHATCSIHTCAHTHMESYSCKHLAPHVGGVWLRQEAVNHQAMGPEGYRGMPAQLSQRGQKGGKDMSYCRARITQLKGTFHLFRHLERFLRHSCVVFHKQALCVS